MPSFFKPTVLLFALVAAVAANVGDVTLYDPGLGACGIPNSSSDLVAAVSAQFFDTFPGATPNPNLNPICGRMITVNYQGRSVRVMVADRCLGCAGLFDLDLSPAAFDQLSDLAAGRLVGAEWSLDSVAKRNTIEIARGNPAVEERSKAVEHRMIRRTLGEAKL